jgi:hypothetical protein
MCFWVSIVILTLLVCQCVGGSQQVNTDKRRPFLVQDAIEVSYIIDATAAATIEEQGAFPPGRPIVSPDKKRFLIVTQRGVLSTNKIEATIWLFVYKTVREYAVRRSSVRPHPTMIARLAAESNTAVVSLSVGLIRVASRF